MRLPGVGELLEDVVACRSLVSRPIRDVTDSSKDSSTSHAAFQHTFDRPTREPRTLSPIHSRNPHVEYRKSTLSRVSFFPYKTGTFSKFEASRDSTRMKRASCLPFHRTLEMIRRKESLETSTTPSLSKDTHVALKCPTRWRALATSSVGTPLSLVTTYATRC